MSYCVVRAAVHKVMSRLPYKILAGDKVLPSVTQLQSWLWFKLEVGPDDLHRLLATWIIQLLYKVRYGAQHELKITLTTPTKLCVTTARPLSVPWLVSGWFWADRVICWHTGTLSRSCSLPLFSPFRFSGAWIIWAVTDIGSIFNRGWLRWGLREKRVQKTLHHLQTLQLRVLSEHGWREWGGEHVLANASVSSRGWNLPFSGWRLIWQIKMEHKCTSFFFSSWLLSFFIPLHYCCRVVYGTTV